MVEEDEDEEETIRVWKIMKYGQSIRLTRVADGTQEVRDVVC